jgi:predicted TIM-barrel fold metal-dependent hydrolase
MLNGYQIFDADAHTMMSPTMWADLPEDFAARRPRAVRISDESGLGYWNTGWYVDGRLEPHPFGPGAQSANTPAMVLDEFKPAPGKPRAAIGSNEFSVPAASLDLSDPEARLQNLERMAVDIQMLFPSTLYAHMTFDPGFEAALYRSYNRYVGRQCRAAPKRLKWAGLLPMRDQSEAIKALDEMQQLGATAAVVFGTVGERLLSDPSFTPIWDAFARGTLPLCIHMGMSYPPFQDLCHSIQDANMIAKALPAQLAFVAVVGNKMLDRYPNLRVAFLEFGAEWIFYMFGRMDHYLKVNRRRMPSITALPQKEVEDYAKCGRIFIAPESDDPMLTQEIALLGADQILFSSDFPHGEGRENAALSILERGDLSAEQKRKILYDNPIKFFGAP